MKSNYHTHTQRCRHAFGTEEDYLGFALEAGLSILGFSDHAPYPDNNFGRMPYEELVTYFETVERLAEENASRITIKKGLEIEYIPRYMPYYEELYSRHKVDYLLLGEHFFDDGTGDLLNIYQAPDTEANVRYARAIEEAMTTGYFQIVAHPDLYTVNHFAWDDNCEAAADIILNAAAKTGVVLEFNANGFRRGVHDYPDGKRYMYPHMRFWEKVVGTGLPVVIGSDCHEACQVWDECMPKAQQTLRELGITPLESLSF